MSQAIGNVRGGIFRKFLFPQVSLIVFTTILALWWAGESRVRAARAVLEEVSLSQALLAEALRLPLGTELAGRFSDLSGFKVGLRAADGGLRTAEQWTEDELKLAWEVLQNEGSRVVARGKMDGIAVAVGRDGAQLVALQERPAWFSGGAVWPVGLGGLLALGSAFAMARLVGRPLAELSEQALRNETFRPELLARRDEVGHLAQALTEARARLREEEKRRKASEQMALLGKMATSMAHEIKNPAAAILMQAEVLEETDREGVAKLIKEDGEEIVSLVNQWLFVARPEPPARRPVALATLVEELAQRMTPWIEFHRCRLQLACDAGLHCHGDKARLGQVFRNLTQNAVQAMPAGGVVTVGIAQSEEKGWLDFWVEDEGAGFSPEAAEAFGEAFYSERDGGIGLGLALVKGVVESHGGFIKVEKARQGGARVCGRIPSYTEFS
ncbi:MAG: HAMP domain-containing sensor histidine kinase [Verrucomicrobiota bacterium JB023]|nr:HAMP domain-containing sensor histidine kinase [Verrucomicrobiota bacterium JB023]